jgi:HEPN domain-containing protein
MENWKTQIQAELERASNARQRGNEGQARVCARRAAGIAIREYYSRRGQILRSPSAYDLLKIFLEDDQGTPELKQSAVYLTMRVNNEFNLPAHVDLLVEARQFCYSLLDDQRRSTD